MPDDSFGLDFHKSLVDNMADGVYFVEPDRTIRYWNRGAERIAGFAPDQIVGRRCFDNMLAHVDEFGNSLCHSTCPLAASMLDGEGRDVTVWLRHEDGHRKPVRVRTAAVRDAQGKIVGGVEVFSDATAVVRAVEDANRARQDSLTDELTGLPNRRMLDAALRVRLDNLSRYGWEFGFVIADVDNFKEVNDTSGHAVGDAALAGIAATLLGAVRSGDFVARWGGDEFAILVEASEEEGLRETSERVRALVAQSEVRFEGITLSLHVSLGGTLALPEDTPEVLFARADQALYAAKNNGRNKVIVSAPRSASLRTDAGSGI